MKKIASCLISLVGLFTLNGAYADCAADATVADVRKAHTRGQQLEKSGDARGALAAYVAAQAYTCEANPVAAEAARRGAALAKPLGDAAKAKGDHAAAFGYYERGGHFAAADREMLARMQAAPDDISLYSEALRHVQHHGLPAFQANEAVRLAVTGAYMLDPALAQAVAAMPAKATERALAAEAAAFNEAWYAQYVALIRARPENPTDFAALQQFAARMQALQTQHGGDPLRDPVEIIERVQRWQTQVVNNDQAAALARKRAERAEARASLLTQKYADAPKLLELAIDYLGHSTGDSEAQQPRLLKVRRQAESLGDAALAKKRYQLAIDYFDVAGADDKAGRVRTQLQALAQQQMQPTLTALQRDAEALKAQFSDPARIAEMQRQAQEMQRALQKSAQERKNPGGRKGAEDLAAELGM
jgi:hypothetical protein